MWNKQKISVIFPAYDEEQNIRNAIKDFNSLGIVDEIIVVDNNSRDKTAEEVSRTKAILVKETKQGYGWALRRGLNEANGDFIVTCEPDGTFRAKDLYKLLMYIDEFDAVFGTRTSKECVWNGANMNWFLRFGNLFIAKVLEYIHNGPCLTDVGCTFKLIKKSALDKIINQFTVGKSHFSPEFMILCIKNNIKCVEVPIIYKGRLGDSKITGSSYKALKLGLVMIGLILRRRLK